MKGRAFIRTGVLFIFMVLPALGYCFSVDQAGTMEFKGQLETRNTVSAEHSDSWSSPQYNAWDLIEQRNTVKVEWNHNLEAVTRDWGFNTKYHLVGRAFYNSLYEHGPNMWRTLHDDADAGLRRNIHEYQEGIEFREGYIDFTRGANLLRLGKQNVVWGETDMFRLLDGVNPLDSSKGAVEELDEQRLPLWMARATVGFDKVAFVASPFLDGFIAPCFGQTKDLFGPSAPSGSPFAINASAPTSMPWVTSNTMESTDPNTSISDSRWGMRFGGVIADNYNFTIAHYSTYSDTTPLVAMSNFVDLTGDGVPDAPSVINTVLVHEKVHVTGASLNFFQSAISTVIRSEIAMRWHDPIFISSVNMGTNPTIQNKNVGNFMVGFDYNWDAPFLNRTKTITVVGQYFGKYIFAYDDRQSLALQDQWASGYPYQHQPKYESTLTLDLSTEYFSGRFAPEIFVAYMPQGNWMVMPTLKFTYAEWQFTLKGNFVNANSLNNFGAYKAHDFVSLSIKYMIN